MRGIKTLVKPEIKTVYLNNQTSERVEYLEIPSDLDRDSLRKDIENGAVHFQDVDDFLEKKKHSRFIVVSSENKETGLMAISYMAACLYKPEEDDILWDFEEYLSEKKNPFKESNIFEDDYGNIWNESGKKLPIIYAGEIKQYLYQNNESFDMGIYRMQQKNMMSNDRPYWTNCKKEAVCIICDRFQAEELSTSALEMFCTNRYVFLLYINKYSGGFRAQNYPFEMGGNVFEKIKNNIILTYAADEIGVFLDKTDSKAYYTHILKENLKRRGVKVSRDFSYVRIINLAVSLRKDADCKLCFER